MTAPRRQLSLTIDAGLVREVEACVKKGDFPNRSAAVEAALRAWAKQQRTVDLHAYYDQVSSTEAQEQEALAEAGWQALAPKTASRKRARR